ncbi:S1C family serine protease [Streptantibioticus rubrisoli]|uniref:Trypsin-like peptidase domain-containing protein n=1 Tax=Streptantibioticus rubrisoli TaxID=1387313 RepID=A0ABT1PLJ7_9ACTN|nr:trypsin-like peptidase domain-containing protein [Streptantibioticus rubrisoli]MCQ4046220.1 trypsin-like peptidase domain-containing protein [Streptantibioticus rubrisoli]
MNRPRVPGSARCTSVTRPLVHAAAAICVTALLADCSGGKTSATPTSAASPPPPTVTNSLENDFRQVVRNVLPSVVQITSDAGLGSGVLYDTNGDVVTNAHVVGNARDFKVTLATGKDTLDAALVGSYPGDDLAVLRLKNPPGGLKPATFGDTSKVAVGQVALAMGNPLGLSSSVTQGIVSAVGRTVSEGGGGGTNATIGNMVQTSAAINPGNSGGALVNLSGQVIGIPTLAAVDPGLGGGTAAGIGFAIPASTVNNIAGQLIRNGKVTASGRAALGITARTVLNGNLEPAGVTVVTATRGGPADKAGLKPGDIVTKIDGTQVTTDSSLSEALAAFKPGDRTDVTYVHDDTTKTVTVTLGQL